MKNKRFNLIIATCVLLFTLPVSVTAQTSMDKIVDDALAFSLQQSMGMYETLKKQPNLLPRSVENGKFMTCKPSNWVSGFFPGMLWYLYENSNDTSVLRAAEDMTSRIEDQQYDTTNHDVGFKINCSFGNGYRLTGKEAYRQVIINGAKSLSTRFNPVVGCTRS